MTALMNAYGNRTVTFQKGEGAWLWDTDGKRYLDALGGIAVCALGHTHPAVSQAICEQASQLVHTSNLYNIAGQSQLGEKLCRVADMDKVFFANSGAEANEAALKIARLHGRKRNIANPAVIVFENAFHGRTLATLSATGNRKVHAGFEPLVQGFVRAPYDDIDALKNIAERNSNIVAIMVEPIQGEGGIHVPSDDYLQAIRALCDRYDWLMMTDEIQTGMGRTGQWFAYQHSGITPDVVTVAKALGNGVPIGACLAKGEAAELIQPGNHGTTFGGNPLACSAGLAVINTIESDDLVNRADALGQRIQSGLAEQLADCDALVEVRGKGLMIGIELNQDCTPLPAQAMQSGLLLNVTAGNVVRLLPAYILTDEEADMIVQRVADLIKAFLAASPAEES